MRLSVTNSLVIVDRMVWYFLLFELYLSLLFLPFIISFSLLPTHHTVLAQEAINSVMYLP
jgi:hypothetical protein